MGISRWDKWGQGHYALLGMALNKCANCISRAGLLLLLANHGCSVLFAQIEYNDPAIFP
jgi:hypothetical protein